jgi:SAM-dependent methyltransferase
MNVIEKTLTQLGVLAPAFRLREYLRAAKWPPPPASAPDGLPFPGRLNMVRVVAHADAKRFYESGAETMAYFADATNQIGVPIANARAILDWGCGCGRLARHAPRVSAGTLYGFDIDALNIAWARENLPGSYALCGLSPPLPLADATIDVAFALSVFTHLGADSQRAWLAEFARLIAPGGALILTFHDPGHRAAATAETGDRFALEGIDQPRAALEGTNYAVTVQTFDQIKAAAAGLFEAVLGRRSDETPFGQAMVVFRRV